MNEYGSSLDEDCAGDTLTGMENDMLDEISSESNFIEFDERMDLSQEILSVVDQNVQPLILPKANGEWSGEPGNSEFVMDDDYVPSGRGVNLEKLTMAEIKEKYGFDGVNYENKEPDFSPFVDLDIGTISLEEFSEERTGKGGTYNLANEKAVEELGVSKKEIRKMIKERGLTWHECDDRKTVMPIPTEINAAFKHSGGISVEKGVNALSQYLRDEYGELKLEPSTPFSRSVEVELDIDAAHKEIQNRVKNNRNKTD